MSLLIFALAVAGTSNLEPLKLHVGYNVVSNIAGDGKPGSIFLAWRENGNAWGYDIYTVQAAGSVATVDGDDRFVDRPHTGEDVITSVRFASRIYKGRATLHAFVADRNVITSVPDPARTTIKVYALVRNDEGLGTPYEFRLIRSLTAKRLYCNAEMALKTELAMSVTNSYAGPRNIDGCLR